MRPVARHFNGFTLIELLTATAALAILLGIVLPSAANALDAARATDAKANLVASVAQGVQRAALTGRHVVLCASGDGLTCARSTDWSRGWILFVDRDGDRQRADDETLLRSQPALNGQVRITSTVGRTRIVFQPNGGNAGSNVTFTLCDRRGPARAETFVLNNRGGMRTGAPSATALATTCPARG